MKKSCDDCRALSGTKCSLGYKNKLKLININGSIINKGLKPIEDCPKPKTYKELLYEKEIN